MKLILIRHAKTAGNLRGVYLGSTDEPLDPSGASQLCALARCGIYPDVERVYSSPMRRVQETARIVYPAIPHIEMEELRECDFGAFEGKSYAELAGDPAYQAWLDSGGTLPFPKGEDPLKFRVRCHQGFKLLVDQALELGLEHVAVIAHGGTIMAILERYSMERKAFYDWQVENCGGYITRIERPAWKNGSLEVLKRIDTHVEGV